MIPFCFGPEPASETTSPLIVLDSDSSLGSRSPVRKRTRARKPSIIDRTRITRVTLTGEEDQARGHSGAVEVPRNAEFLISMRDPLSLELVPRVFDTSLDETG